jgi:hypothetical protein
MTGQGPNPLAWLLYSTDDASVAVPTWTDATSKLRSFSTGRGRQSELSDVDTGQATITLDNRDRGLDPTSNTALRPMNQWWIREQFSGETQDIFYGYATRYDLDYPETSFDATTTVHASDESIVLNLRNLPVTDPPRDTYADVVQFDAPTGYWQFDDAAAANHVLQPTVGAKPFIGGYLSGGSGYTSATSAIVGDSGWALKRLNSSTSPILSQIQTGDPGDFTTLSEMTVECWFQTTNTTPAANIGIFFGPLDSGSSNMFTLVMTTTGPSRREYR